MIDQFAPSKIDLSGIRSMDRELLIVNKAKQKPK